MNGTAGGDGRPLDCRADPLQAPLAWVTASPQAWSVPSHALPWRADEVLVWWSRADGAWTPAQEAERATWLDPEERARMGRFIRPGHRRLFLAAHALLRLALAQVAPRHPGLWRFVRAPKGRPELAPGQGAPAGLSFNLSHCRGLCAVALAREADVGVDVEVDRPLSQLEALAAACLTPGERASLAGLPLAAQRSHFLDLWALKEAALKACGQGLRVSPQEVEIDAAGARRGQGGLTLGPAFRAQGRPGAWRLGLRRLSPHGRLAVAVGRPSSEAPPPSRWRLLELVG